MGKRTKSQVNCDPKKVVEFDYSVLEPALSKLSRPAQRALISKKIYKVKDLAKYSLKEILSLHGMGPASAPLIKKYTKK